MTFLGFGTPLILMALAVLPVIWFLLRITPPRPNREPFAPLKILQQIDHREKTAQKTPWWMILLRLFIVGLVIIALAQPLVNPRPSLLEDETPLILMIDNGFAAKPHWQDQIAAAKNLIRQAQLQEKPVYIITTVQDRDMVQGPYLANDAANILEQLQPLPALTHRMETINHLHDITQTTEHIQLAYLTDGLASDHDETAWDHLKTLNIEPIIWYQANIEELVGLTFMENGAQTMQIHGLRSFNNAEAQYDISAYDKRGRRLSRETMIFAPNEIQAITEFHLPVEMRNDVAFLALEKAGQEITNAAAIYLTSSTDQRRRIALLSRPISEMVQPLLAPLYYPIRALASFGDLVLASSASTSVNIDRLLEANPALLVIGDDITIPSTQIEKITHWIEQGGTLLRFAGPKLANNPTEDPLLPVQLRRGERTMGGIMSWTVPQKITATAPNSPLLGLDIPDNVTVSRQILAAPDPDLFDKSWVTLRDGTPLVSAQSRGRGRLIFVHTTPTPEWSNLALSGFFVDMLHRFVMTANSPLSQDTLISTDLNASRSLAPWRMLSVEGKLLTPSPSVQPLTVTPGQISRPDFYHPPGLYGNENEVFALNLLEPDSRFEPLSPPQHLNLSLQDYAAKDNLPLDGLLWGMALFLFTLDCLIMAIQQGYLRPLAPKRMLWHTNTAVRSHIAGMLFLSLSIILFYPLHNGYAQPKNQSLNEQNAQTQFFVTRAAKTHLAYVTTGNHDLDALSQAGLNTLSQFIASRTTIEPGEAVGVDLENDELGFYPLLYWPIDASLPLPSQHAISQLDAYMHQGGSVLFDTRDGLISSFHFNGKPTDATAYLRAILDNLDIPPLEPVPTNHVIARSFYIMPEFPGRYRSSPLWLEALPFNEEQGQNNSTVYPPPIVRSGDGVSSILITANDFIGAWAQDANYEWLYPTVPNEPMQRLLSLRGGLNIVMYLLSGNYKADQVHAAELLKRLGE